MSGFCEDFDAFCNVLTKKMVNFVVRRLCFAHFVAVADSILAADSGPTRPVDITS